MLRCIQPEAKQLVLPASGIFLLQTSEMPVWVELKHIEYYICTYIEFGCSLRKGVSVLITTK